jgi:hypothetical protein
MKKFIGLICVFGFIVGGCVDKQKPVPDKSVLTQFIPITRAQLFETTVGTRTYAQVEYTLNVSSLTSGKYCIKVNAYPTKTATKFSVESISDIAPSTTEIKLKSDKIEWPANTPFFAGCSGEIVVPTTK